MSEHRTVLILGGTAEARAFADQIPAGMRAIYALAGRTRAPRLPDCEIRVGGFGGAEGLAAYLKDAGVRAVIDATHPFAARISANAVAACARAEVPLLRLARPGWREMPGDAWTRVPDAAAAARALGDVPRRVWLTIGRQDLAPFPPGHRYWLRCVEPPDAPPPGAVVELARGPFRPEEEAAFLRDHGIEILVTKDSGGARAKLDAAREAGVGVVMIARPVLPAAEEVARIEDALAWLRAHPGTERGV